MGIPPIRIDCTLPLSPIPAPSPARGAYLGAREPSQRALSNRISSQPKVIRHPRRREGDDEDEALGRGGGREKRSKKENKEREREREETKDKKIGEQDESRQRIRLNFFARDVRPPPLFPPCLAREIQFSCPHASTHDSTCHDDNERPRSTERHPCTSPRRVSTDKRGWKRAFVLRTSRVRSPTELGSSSVACSDGDEDEVACDSPRVIRRCVFIAHRLAAAWRVN